MARVHEEPGLLTVESCNAAGLDEWQSFVDSHPDARAMNHAGWLRVLSDAGSVNPHFLVARSKDGRIAGILSGYFSRSLFTGPHFTTLDDGVLALNPAAGQALVERAREMAAAQGGRYLLLRGGDGFGCRPDRVHESITTLVDTRGSEEDLWGRVKRKTRWYVRQGRRNGIQIGLDPGLEKIDEFYRLYASHVHRLGTPVFGKGLMRAMARYLGPDRLRLYVAQRNAEVIGGMLTVRAKQVWLNLYAFVREDLLPTSANYLLYWEAIRAAGQEGAIALDLGRSLPGSGVHLFKTKWGGHDHPLTYCYFASPRQRLKAGLERYRTQTTLRQRLWKRLPLSVANTLGPVLRRGLPFG